MRSLTAIRYFCHVTPQPGHAWGDLGFDYFSAIKSADLPIRVLAAMGVADVGDESSRWHENAACFATELPTVYANVICADNGELVRLFTVGVRNVAITTAVRLPTKKEIRVLSDYDAILTPSQDDAAALKQLGLIATHVAPEPNTLRSVFQTP